MATATETRQPSVHVAQPANLDGKVISAETVSKFRAPNSLTLTYWRLELDDKPSARRNAPKAKFMLTSQWSNVGLRSKSVQGILFVGRREHQARLTVTGTRVTLVIL